MREAETEVRVIHEDEGIIDRSVQLPLLSEKFSALREFQRSCVLHMTKDQRQQGPSAGTRLVPAAGERHCSIPGTCDCRRRSKRKFYNINEGDTEQDTKGLDAET